ncbi:MAG: prolyl oligopeptidase family serine peptidase [Planctomycetes bacterium]|nr:prolyl oligopeptidase family serine peptidase [Planctomycetota bacterium]
MRTSTMLWGGAVFLALVAPSWAWAEDKPIITVHRTPSGVRFALQGAKGKSPAPTLFVFATGAEESLRNADFNKVGRLLGRQGYLCVSLDIPCHGEDQNAKETGLGGWRVRLEKGDMLVPGFVAKASAVLDHLIKEGYTDPRRVAACGTSRGGFIALHFAAAEPRVRCVAAFAPVTNLLALREFTGMEKHKATRALALTHSAGKLAGRHVWVCIGNRDERVNTDDVIALTRRVVAASSASDKAVPVELHVMPTVGHRIHDTAHEEAAAWVLACMKDAGAGR